MSDDISGRWNLKSGKCIRHDELVCNSCLKYDFDDCWIELLRLRDVERDFRETLKRLSEMAKAERKNTALLATNPCQSQAAYRIETAIREEIAKRPEVKP
jgi:hypothetical protein